MATDSNDPEPFWCARFFSKHSYFFLLSCDPMWLKLKEGGWAVRLSKILVRLTQPLKIGIKIVVSNRNLLSQVSIDRCYVTSKGGSSMPEAGSGCMLFALMWRCLVFTEKLATGAAAGKTKIISESLKVFRSIACKYRIMCIYIYVCQCMHVFDW